MKNDLRGIIPVDLKEVKTTWREFSFKGRLDLMLLLAGEYHLRWNFSDRDKLIASLIATTMLEQPKSFPNNNCLGLGVWGERFPWGWKRGYWVNHPNGFIIVKEGYGGKKAVLFSFKYLADCLLFAGKVWEDRKILTYADYEKRWLGGKNPQGRKFWETKYSEAMDYLASHRRDI